MRVLLILAFPLLAAAQGSGSIAAPPSVSGSGAVPFQVTKSITGIVRESGTGRIVIEDSKRKLELKTSNSVKVSGVRNATLESVEPGLRVRANYTANDMALRDIRILETKR